MRDARLNILSLLISTLSSFCLCAQEPEIPDSIPEEPLPTKIDVDAAAEVLVVDSIIPVSPEFVSWGTSQPPANVGAPEDTNRNWWHLLRKGKLKMNDPTVEWPGFLGLCVKVYNWGDRVFSATDPDYVEGTGKKWRARIVNDNWADSYHMVIRSKFNSVMSSPFHVLWGASLQYMAVSYTYSVDVTHLLTRSPINYRKQEFGFNCARFSADGYYYSNNATYIHSFKGYRGHLREKFSGINMQIFGIDAYYFFNGYKYSQGAAYNFSKIQKKSQGCIMAGFAYCNQDISLDFSKLPSNLLPYLKLNDLYYRFHYNDYNLLMGYGYNCVISPHWLYNITVIPGIGFNHCYEDSSDGSAKLFSVSGRAMTSFTFNSGNWFAGLQGKIRGNWYQSGPLHLFNAVENVVLSGGIRF